jgi:hypothetical protein
MDLHVPPSDALRRSLIVAFDFLSTIISRSGLSLVIAALFAGLGACYCEAAAAVVSNQLAITSISMQGTNLVLTATVPPGVAQVALQTRSSLDVPWEEVGNESAPVGGGEMIFTYPQSGEVSRFFRLRANSTVQTPEMVSAELEFVPIASLSSHLSDGNAVFHFKGTVDGSDRILITHDGALWDHVNWGFPPEPVAVNDTPWNPSEKNYMSAVAPAKFLPESFSLESAKLEVIEGRDVVAIERTNNALLVYLDDTPKGASEYELNIYFPPASPKLAAAQPSTVAHLKIGARVDGSDQIKITAREAALEHYGFHLPSNLSINGISWDSPGKNTFKNEGATAFLPEGVDFSTARIIARKGRDLATAWGEKDALWVRFADNPNGSDYYEIEIAFGPESTQP